MNRELIMEVSLYVGCSVNCSYCPQFSLFRLSKKRKMSVDDYKIFLDKIPSTTHIGFIGMSEPLLYKEFDRIIEYTLHKKHKMICFTTLPEKIQANVDIFLDETLWYRRSVHIKDEHMSCKIITRQYIHNLEKYFDQIDINDKDKQNSITILSDNIDSQIENLILKYNLQDYVFRTQPFQRIRAPITYKAPVIPPKLLGKIYCSQGHDKIQHLLPDGDVVLCCMDVEKVHVLGNLFKNSYQDLYNSKEYTYVQQGYNDDRVKTICRTCIFAKNVI